MSAAVPAVAQRSFDDLGAPLADVTFCVVDLETTGGSPSDDEITEIGAVKLRGGECLGTFQTLVDPGRAIPPKITVLTGISDAMVMRAPRISAVLPSLLEFIGGSVVVGHNVRFDLGFMRRAIERDGYQTLENRSVDTATIARRVVGEEVPNCRLATLASRLRLDHQPSHRALDDALATGDLLHHLLERVAVWGVTGLDDLLGLTTMSGHAQAHKLTLTEGLPRSPGVYMFRGRGGEILYVGKATNLRQRVRSYFSSDTRRKIGQLLREAVSVEHRVTTSPTEAGVLELRLINEHRPRFNRQGKKLTKRVYVKLTAEAFPRLSIARVRADDGGTYLGPLPSRRAAQRVVDAIEMAVPIRRCTARVTAPTRAAPCAPAQLGVATCPCAGQIDAGTYRGIAELVVHGLGASPERLLGPLEERMRRLASESRFEEAADVRDRADALTTALQRQRHVEALDRAERLVVELDDGIEHIIDAGRLVEVRRRDDPPRLAFDPPTDDELDATTRLEEMLHLARCIERAERAIVVSCSGEFASPLPRIPSYRPRAVDAGDER